MDGLSTEYMKSSVSKLKSKSVNPRQLSKYEYLPKKIIFINADASGESANYDTLGQGGQKFPVVIYGCPLSLFSFL